MSETNSHGIAHTTKHKNLSRPRAEDPRRRHAAVCLFSETKYRACVDHDQIADSYSSQHRSNCTGPPRRKSGALGCCGGYSNHPHRRRAVRDFAAAPDSLGTTSRSFRKMEIVFRNGNGEEFSARSPVGARLCAATFPAFGKCRVDTRRTMRCETRYTSCREHEYSSHRNSREQLDPPPPAPERGARSPSASQAHG